MKELFNYIINLKINYIKHIYFKISAQNYVNDLLMLINNLSTFENNIIIFILKLL